MRSLLSVTATVVCVALILGCSSSHKAGVVPDLTQPPDNQLTAPAERVGTGTGHTVLWGLWNIVMDLDSHSVEIVPVRGVQWTVNVTKFLQPPAGKPGNLKVMIVDTTDWLTLGMIEVDVTLVHPFPGLLQYTGADVRGVFIGTGHRTAAYDPGLVYTDGGAEDPYLANADGYTRWMNPIEFPDDDTLWTYTEGMLGMGSGFDATLNPYKYFVDGLDAEDDLYGFFSVTGNLANRGQFKSGSINTRRYDLYFPLTGGGGEPLLAYQYAVLASWEPPENLDPGDLPGSFPPDANTREAFLLNVVDNSTLYYTEEEAGGDLILELEVFDWAPFLGVSGSVLDEIERIVVESPQGILPSPYVEFDHATLAASAMPGTTDASSIVPVEIASCLPIDVEGQEAMIAIEHSNGYGYDNYGYGSVYPDAPLTAYFFYVLEVSATVPQQDEPVVDSIDPDHGIPDTHIYDVVITGDNLSGVTEAELVGDSEQTTAINLVVVDDEHLMFELDLAGLSLGFYDVVAHDPDLGDGVLEDGFEVMDCPGGIHDNLTLYTTDIEYSPLFVAGVLTSGPYAGQTVTQRGMPAWNRIVVADPPADNTPVVFYANKPSLSAMYNDWSWSMDMDPLNEVFAFTTFDDDDDSGSWPNTQFDFVKICNQSDGSYVGACDTDCGYAVAQVDIDEYGNVWAVCSNAYYPNFGFTLQRWDYDAAAPAPHYTFINEYDISSIITGNKVISDIVVLQRYRRLFISRSPNSGWGVTVDAWDISTDPPTYLSSTTTTATGFYGTNSFQEVHQRFVDMEVDRTDDILAGCRILVMFMGKPGANRTLELRKYDVNLNLINSDSIEFNYVYTDDCFNQVRQMWFSNFVLDDQHDGRIVAIYDNFCVPPPGHFGVEEPPADW